MLRSPSWTRPGAYELRRGVVGGQAEPLRGGDHRAVAHQAPAHALRAEAVPVMGGEDLPAELTPQTELVGRQRAAGAHRQARARTAAKHSPTANAAGRRAATSRAPRGRLRRGCSQQAAATDIRAAMRQVREVEILAVRGLGIIGLNDSLLRPAVIHGAPHLVRALLLDPDSHAAERRAAEIGESVESFRGGVWLAVAQLRELAEHTDATVEAYLYDLLPTWRVITLDSTMFVSAFGEDHEGHMSPMYRIDTTASGGALHRGFRRFAGELRRTARRVV